ncbi:MAG TPA: 4Fe-4S dicluster domain-containing protein [Methanosarcinaceae archaeon]|nr:4Fe-4S dicluster domain-containing protein [Methanosarcinaceae archaeon]
MAKSKKIKNGKSIKEVAKLKLKLKRNRCDKSPLCPVIKICTLDAITQKRRGFLNLFADYPEIDPGKCMGCGVCVDACPRGAIYMKPIDTKNKNKSYKNN